MNAKQMAELLQTYRRFSSMTDPLRYSCRVSSVEDSDGIFGMNFDKIFSLPPQEQDAWFLRQQKQADLIRMLMCGQMPDAGIFQDMFGYAAEDVKRELAELSPLKQPVPDRLVILSFDDAILDQYELAAPLLQEMGFGATFFITEMPDAPGRPGFADKTRYMTWEKIRTLQEMGFEIGNHTKNHIFGLQDMGSEKFLAEVYALESDLEAHGIVRPVSFAYPCGISNSNTANDIRGAGYLWGRGNCETGICGMRGMSVYEPPVDSPLSQPAFGDPDYYDEALLRQRLRLASDGRILHLTYHSVSPDHWLSPCSFRRQMEILKEEGCTVIAMRDLETYIDPVKAARCNPL